MTSTEKLRPAIVAALLVLEGIAHAQGRSAQDIESARQLFNDGMELRDRGDLKGALEKLRAAHALGNTPITGIELCRTYAALRQPVEAREVCLGVARIPETAQETQRSKDARAEAPRIAEAERAKIGMLRVHLTGVAPGRSPTVTVDDAPVPEAALGQPRAVNPGAHVVVARAGGPEARASVTVQAGVTTEAELAVPPPDPTQAPPVVTTTTTPQEPPRTVAAHRSLALPITALAVGGGALFFGLVSGLVALDKKSALDDNCTDKLCGREYHSDLSSAKAWGNVSTAMFIVGPLFVAGGLVALLAGKPAKPTAKLTPTFGFGSAGLHGSF